MPLSLLVVFLAVVLVKLASDSALLLTLYCELNSSVGAGRWVEVQQQISKIRHAENRDIAIRWSESIGVDPRWRTAIHNATSDETYNALVDLARLKLDAVLERYRPFVSRNRGYLLRDLNLPEEQASAILDDVERELENIHSLLGKIARVEASVEQLDQSLRSVYQRFELLGDDFGELLGLEPLKADPAANELPIYRSGVLAGLPKLVDLPDYIPDSDSLGQIVLNIGAKVVKGPNAHVVFAESLQRTRTKIETVKADYAQLRSSYINNKEKLSSLRKERVALADQISTKLSSILLAISRPPFASTSNALDRSMGYPSMQHPSCDIWGPLVTGLAKWLKEEARSLWAGFVSLTDRDR